MSQVREVSRVVSAHRQEEGAGFIVRRPLPSISLALADPFLLIDEMGPVDYRPGEAVGAPVVSPARASRSGASRTPRPRRRRSS